MSCSLDCHCDRSFYDTVDRPKEQTSLIGRSACKNYEKSLIQKQSVVPAHVARLNNIRFTIIIDLGLNKRIIYIGEINNETVLQHWQIIQEPVLKFVRRKRNRNPNDRYDRVPFKGEIKYFIYEQHK